MTISRVYPAAWSLGEKLTSAQMNALDISHTSAADKRTGQTDSIGAVWQATGAGRLIGNTNAVVGDRISVLNRSNFYVRVQNAAAADLLVIGTAVGNGSPGESCWGDFIFNGVAWQLYRSAKPLSQEEQLFTSNGSLVVPRSITQMLYIGSGAGGGGAGGCPAATSSRISCGGAGGGGAVERIGIVRVIAGETINCNPGAGGTAGAGGATPTNGGNGGDSTIVRASGPVTLANMLGAAGGSRGLADNQENVIFTAPNTQFVYQVARGGSPTRKVSNLVVATNSIFDHSTFIDGTPSAGARGKSGNGLQGLLSETGNTSPQGWGGGNSASPGSTTGVWLGGGPGGGGGGGPYGAGANGGNGGNGDGTGASTNGTVGSSAAANTGAGGGGGGAAGGSNTGNGVGGNGGAGGSGRILTIFLH